MITSETAGLMEQGLYELGFDSLIAVELRSWFMKELHIDMPVMKMIGSASAGDLLSYAIKKLPGELTPNLTSGESYLDVDSVIVKGHPVA